MPVLELHLRRRATVEPDELGMNFRDLHHACREACREPPDIAREELLGRDPMVCASLICHARGRQRVQIEFSERLPPSEWQRLRPSASPRRHRARDGLALASFRRMFSPVNAGYVVMTPALAVVEMNEIGARHSHVDQEARGTSILDISDRSGAMLLRVVAGSTA